MADWLGASLITSHQSPGRGGSGWGSRPNVFLGGSASRKANTHFEIVKSQEHKNSFNLPNFGGLSLSASSQPQKTWKQRQKCQVWGGIGSGGGGEECFQKEGVKLGSQAGKERTSGNMSASWSRPRSQCPRSGSMHYERPAVATGLWVRQTCMPDAEASSILHSPAALGRPFNLSEPHWPNLENGDSDSTHVPGWPRGQNENTQRTQISTVPSAH